MATKKNLLPFNLEKALEGYPVCLEDGTLVQRIAYFPEANKQLFSVIALISGKYCYFHKDGKGYERNLYLLEEVEECEGWIAVYHDGAVGVTAGFSFPSKEEAQSRCPHAQSYVKVTWTKQRSSRQS